MAIMIALPWDSENGGVTHVANTLATYITACGEDVVFLFPGTARRLVRKTARNGFTAYEMRLRESGVGDRSITAMVAFLAFLPKTVYDLWRIIRLHRIQIVNVHYPISPFSYFAILRVLCSIKLVSSVHGADFLPEGRSLPSYPRALRWLISASDLIVAPSRGHLNDFLEIFPHLAPKAVCIHNSLAVEDFHGAVDRPSSLPQRRYLLCIAQLNQKKAVDVLLRAYSNLGEDYLELDLVLAGDGPLRESLEAMVDQLGVVGRVKFLGHRPRDHIAKLLHGCEVLVLPSRAEPFGIVVLEAMACRKPVIVTRVGGLPEIVEDGVNGLVVPPDDVGQLEQALRILLDDGAMRERIGAAGFATVNDRFRPSAFGKAYRSQFFKLCKSR